MTKKEAAIVSAYTGYLVGSFSDMQGYAENILGEYVFTHQFGDKKFCERLKESAKPDFIAMEIV